MKYSQIYKMTDQNIHIQINATFKYRSQITHFSVFLGYTQYYWNVFILSLKTEKMDTAEGHQFNVCTITQANNISQT